LNMDFKLLFFIFFYILLQNNKFYKITNLLLNLIKSIRLFS
jgi:hypothetical protein